MSYFQKHKEGFILTILFHVAIVLILLFYGFFTPLPLPEEKGVLVDFGNSETGAGPVEPARKPQAVQQEIEETQEQVTPPPPPVSKPEPALPEPPLDEGAEELATQDFEETVAVDEGKKKEEEEKRKREEAARKKKLEEERQRQEEVEKERLAELERQRQIEAEQRRLDNLKKIEEARLAEQRRIAEQRRQDSIRREQEKQAQIDAIDNRAKNVFGGSSGQNDDPVNTSGQGVTYGGNNQGTTTGTAGAERYGLGGGEGISFNLSGRSAENLREPSYPGQEEGVVVVTITVDKYGKVTKAIPGAKGSTSLDSGLSNAAKNAALGTRFNEDPNAPAFQTGTITYRFVLD